MTGPRKILACLAFGLATTNPLPLSASLEAPESWSEAMQAIGDEQWAGAVVYLREATNKNPQQGYVWYQFGRALFGKGDYTDAIKAFLVARAYSQVKGSSSFYIARANLRLDRKELAIQWLYRARNDGFDDTDALQKEHDLDPLRGDDRFRNLLKNYTRYGRTRLPVGHPQHVSSWDTDADHVTIKTVAILEGGTGGVSVADDGTVYVGNFGARVYRIRRHGEVDIFRDDLGGASGNAIGKDGQLLQSLFSQRRIARLSGAEDSIIVESKLLSGPVGLAYDGNSTLYVANCDSSYIGRYTAEGGYSIFARHRLFYCPNGITMGPQGDLFVANFFSGAIARVSPSGETQYVAELPESGAAYVAFRDGELYVTGNYGHRLYHISTDGNISVVAGTGERGTRDGPAREARLSHPNGLALSADGECLFFNDGLGDKRDGNNKDGIAPTSALRVAIFEPGSECGGILAPQ